MIRFILSVGCFLPLMAFAQLNFFEKITLRQSFQTVNEKAEPAFITYTNPKHAPNSWAVNAAIGYHLEPPKAILIIDPYFEFHRNTLIEKEQYNWQAGLSAEWQPQNLEAKGWTPVLIIAEKYNEDELKKVSSMQGNLYFTPLFKNKGGQARYFWLPHATTNLGEQVQFYYGPYVGLEHENRIRTAEAAAGGSIYRFLLRITPSFYFRLKKDPVRDRVAVVVDYQYRNDFSKSVDDGSPDDHRYLTVSLMYTVFRTDNDKSAKIGFDYVKGENPAKGFQEQSFYALAFKLKL